MNFLQLRKDHLKITHDVALYPYQEEISNLIINALNQNLRLTASASEEEVKRLRNIEIAIEISRQAGKTTAVVHTDEMIMTFLAAEYGRPIHMGIFAPQIEQARTHFERLKNVLRPIKGLMIQDDEQKARVKEQENAKTLVLPNGSSAFIAPITSTSRPESKSFDIMVFEEAQGNNDKIMKESVWPMGASTNAPRIYIGTAGTRLCHFRALGLRSYDTLKIYFEEIVKQRRQTYEITGDARHLVYEQSVRGDIEKYGLESDEIQRPYFGKWLIGTGQFITNEDIEAITEDRQPTYHDKSHDCFIGIDTAKHPDSTVVTVLRWNPELKKKEVLNWMELKGESYKNQFDIIREFLGNYKVVAVAIDSTGQGEFMPDWFAADTEWADENSGLYPVKFSAVSKDAMYKNLKVSIRELLTTLPNLRIKNGERFKQQMLDLQQQYKGQLLSVSHPDDPNAHDDYPDSWALAEWAYAKYQENAVSIDAVTITNQPERKVKRDANRVVEYWPGLDTT